MADKQTEPKRPEDSPSSVLNPKKSRKMLGFSLKRVQARSKSEVVVSKAEKKAGTLPKSRTGVHSSNRSFLELQEATKSGSRRNLFLAKTNFAEKGRKARRIKTEGTAETENTEDNSFLVDDSDNDSRVSNMTDVARLGGPRTATAKKTKKVKPSLPKLNKLGANIRPKDVKANIGHSDSFSSIKSRSRSIAYSRVIRQSLADVSNQALARKLSLQVEDKETEEMIDEESYKLISIDSRNNMMGELRSLSAAFVFGGLPYDDFDCFKRSPDSMFAFMADAFSALELSVVYNDDNIFLKKFLTKVAGSYHSREEVPFHNFFHGFSVAQVAVTFVLRSGDLKEMFQRKTLFNLIIAAICHDVNHPGNDNYYEIVSGSANAKMFENQSVLENFHTKTTLDIFKGNNGELNILKFLSVDNQEHGFENIADLILATDMSKHKEHQAFLESLESLDQLRGEEKFHERLHLLEVIIHACDLSGQCLSEDLAQTWEENIHFEMLNQLNRLKKQKLPIPHHLQHLEDGQDSIEQRYASQTKFIDFVLIPYWREITRLIPEMSDFLDNLTKNREVFASLGEN